MKTGQRDRREISEKLLLRVFFFFTRHIYLIKRQSLLNENVKSTEIIFVHFIKEIIYNLTRTFLR